MATELALEKSLLDWIHEDSNVCEIKRLYDKFGALCCIHALDIKERICRALFFDDENRLANTSIYNPETGKEIKNITYKSDGKTISSIREYDVSTEKLLNVIFYRQDGSGPSSIIQYDEYGDEVEFTLFGDDGEITTHSI